MRQVHATPIISAAVVLFILGVFIAQKSTDLHTMTALTCFLLSYLFAVGALMIHTTQSRYSRK